MVYILKGGLDVLDRFAEAMAEDNETCVIDLRKNDGSVSNIISNITADDVIITFNNLGTQVSIWKEIGVTLVNILVDHPVYYIEQITKAWYEKYFVACVDRTHVDFLNRVFKGCEKHFLFLPHGGIAKDFAKKDIDILYVGSFHPEEEIVFPPVPGVADSQEFYEKIIEFYEKDNNVTCHEAVIRYAEDKGIDLSEEKLVTWSHYVMCTVEWSFVTMRRKQLIEALALEGLKVDICGREVWQELASKYPENINYHGFKTPEESLDLICRAKILLNDHPNFVDGSHERVFNGMMNHALVVTNESKYLKERFTDGESVLFWDGKDINSLVEKVKKVLNTQDLMCEISQKAFELTKNDSWSSRKNLISGEVNGSGPI